VVIILFVLFAFRFSLEFLFVSLLLFLLDVLFDPINLFQFVQGILFHVLLNSFQLFKALVVFLQLSLEELSVSLIHLWS
jgi:hypothetical protein